MKMTPLELYQDLKARGITLRLAGNGDKLRCRAAEDVITPELQAIITEHKAALIKLLADPQTNEEIIEVVSGDISSRGLNSEEFTRRYLILTQAYRAGVINDQLLDQGIEFLLDHWQAGR